MDVDQSLDVFHKLAKAVWENTNEEERLLIAEDTFNSQFIPLIDQERLTEGDRVNIIMKLMERKSEFNPQTKFRMVALSLVWFNPNISRAYDVLEKLICSDVDLSNEDDDTQEEEE